MTTCSERGIAVNFLSAIKDGQTRCPAVPIHPKAALASCLAMPLSASEQGGIRPVLIIQNNAGNHHSPTVIAAAITGYVKGRHQPTHMRLKGATCGLFRDSTVLLEQLRTLDKSRLDEYMGSVGKDKMREVDAALNISVGLIQTHL